MSPLSLHIAIVRLSLAGIIPISTIAILSEIQKTWNRPDALQFAEAFSSVMPNYLAVIESFLKSESIETFKSKIVQLKNNEQFTNLRSEK